MDSENASESPLNPEKTEIRASMIKNSFVVNLSSGDVPVSYEGALDTRLSSDVINYFITHDPIIYAALQKKTLDMVDNWCEVAKDTPEADKTAWENWVREEKIKSFAQRALFLMFAYGFCPIKLNYSGATDMKPKGRPIGFKIIHPVKLQEQKIENEEVIYYRILQDGETIIYHPDRMIMLRNPSPEVWGYGSTWSGGEWGLSALTPILNILNYKYNVQWGTANALYHLGAPIPYVKVPPTMSSTERSSFEEDFKNFDASLAFVVTKSSQPNTDWEFGQLFEGSKIADSTPFLDRINSEIAAGILVPKYLILGTEAGKIQGSEVNLKDYYSNISSLQTNVLEPFLQELYEKMTGRRAPDLVWNPLFELSEADKAQIELSKARALLATAQAAKAFMEAGIPIGVDENGDIVIKNPEQGAPVDNMLLSSNLNKSVKDKEIKEDAKSQEQKDYETLANAEYKKYAPPWDSLERKTKERITPYWGKIEEQIIKFLDKMKEKYPVVQYDEKGSALKMDAKSYTGAIEMLQGFNISFTAILKDYMKYQQELFEYGFDYTVNQFEFPITFRIGDEELADMALHAHLVWNKVGEDILTQTKYAIAEALKAGVGYDVIQKNIENIVGNDYRGRIDTVARTETHRIVMLGRADSYRKMGIKQVTYHTAGDERVRPTHADMEGGPRDLETALNFLSEPNCRCDIVPYRENITPEFMKKPIGPAAQAKIVELELGG